MIQKKQSEGGFHMFGKSKGGKNSALNDMIDNMEMNLSNNYKSAVKKDVKVYMEMLEELQLEEKISVKEYCYYREIGEDYERKVS